MSDTPTPMPERRIVKGRCPQDELKDFKAEVEVGPHKFVAEGPEIAGINTVMAAITTLGALMNQGVGADYCERVALGIISKLMGAEDKHVLCPMHAVLTFVTMVMTGEAAVIFDPDVGEYRIVNRFVNQMNELLGLKMPGQEKAPPPPRTEPPKADDGGGIFGELPT